MVNNGSKVLWLVKKPMHYLYMDIYMCMYVSFIYIHIISIVLCQSMCLWNCQKFCQKKQNPMFLQWTQFFPQPDLKWSFFFWIISLFEIQLLPSFSSEMQSSATVEATTLISGLDGLGYIASRVISSSTVETTKLILQCGGRPTFSVFCSLSLALFGRCYDYCDYYIGLVKLSFSHAAMSLLLQLAAQNQLKYIYFF